MSEIKMINISVIEQLKEALKEKNLDKFFAILSDYIYVNRELVQAIESHGNIIVLYLVTITITIMPEGDKITSSVYRMKFSR